MGKELVRDNVELNSGLSSGLDFETVYGKDFAKLTGFTTISSEDVKNFALKAPLDIKEHRFLLARESLAAFFVQLEPTFNLLKIDNDLSQTYTNLYFDTPQFDLYRSQGTKLGNRYQVCIKQSRNTNERFLEVERTSQNSKTRKLNMSLAKLENQQVRKCQQAKIDFLNKHLPRRYVRLEVSLMSKFERITLLSKMTMGSQKLITKLTVDFDVELYKPCEHNKECLSELVNITFTEDFRRSSSLSDFQEVFQEAHRLKPVVGNQYARGCALLYPELKQNRFQSLLTAFVG